MRKILLINRKKCTGCNECMLICSLIHYGESSLARSRIFINKKEDTMDFVPTKCVLCWEKPCIEACPAECLSYDETIGIIKCDEKNCIIGCGTCMDACPHYGIRMDKLSNKPLICDMCGGEPSCAKVCLSKAIITKEYSKKNEEEKLSLVSEIDQSIKKIKG